jgi:hypothetical protein
MSKKKRIPKRRRRKYYVEDGTDISVLVGLVEKQPPKIKGVAFHGKTVFVGSGRLLGVEYQGRDSLVASLFLAHDDMGQSLEPSLITTSITQFRTRLGMGGLLQELLLFFDEALVFGCRDAALGAKAEVRKVA